METEDNAKFHIVLVKGWIEKDGKFLLARRSDKELHKPGAWSLPGGKIDSDKNETDILQKTLKREIMEEIGIEVSDDIELVYDNSFVRVDGAHVVSMTFLCHLLSGEARPLEETAEVAWLSLDELKKFKAEEWLRTEIERLEDFLSEC